MMISHFENFVKLISEHFESVAEISEYLLRKSRQTEQNVIE